MKKVLFSLAALGLLAAAPSFAKEKKAAPTTTTYEDSGSGGGGIWVGVALNNLIVKPTAAAAIMPASMSAQFALGNKAAIQAYAALYGVTGQVTFGLGGDVKFSVVGDNRKGFHLGGGFGFGTFAAVAGTSTFFANFAGNLGGHFTIADTVLVSSDFGPLLSVGGGTEFTMTGRSLLLGLSLLMKL